MKILATVEPTFLATSQFSHNLPVSLNNKNTAKNLKLMQVEHASSPRICMNCWNMELGFLMFSGIFFQD